MEKVQQLQILHGAFDLAVQKGAFKLNECEAILDALKAFANDIAEEEKENKIIKE
jgi:hypothetical protein